MFRRSFLGGLVASAFALLLHRHVQAAPSSVLPPEVEKHLPDIMNHHDHKLYFSLQLQRDGSLVWRRCHF